MLNMNSPTVQAMMSNLPQGVGNMPVYFGNTPTLSSSTDLNPTQFNTPYPSPKEMLMQAGQQCVYQPTSFAPRNIVGGYNPGYNAAFNGYVNPYMGYGYSGYNYYNNYAMPLDYETKQTLHAAELNGLDYDSHILNECNIYKRISRIVSKNIGRSDEMAKRCEETFNPKPRVNPNNPQINMIDRPNIKPLHVVIKVGDTIVADMKPDNVNICNYHLIRTTDYPDRIKEADKQIKDQIYDRVVKIHQSVPENKVECKDMFDYFNNLGSFMMDDLMYRYNIQLTTNASKMYDKDKFLRTLLEKNGIKSKSQSKAIDRFVGRYGYMPDGRPVSPGHDPSVAESFSYNVRTGQYEISPPSFIASRLDKARQDFISSIYKNDNGG